MQSACLKLFDRDQIVEISFPDFILNRKLKTVLKSKLFDFDWTAQK
jgi:hypothetical protein